MVKDSSKLRIQLSGIIDQDSIRKAEASIFDFWDGNNSEIIVDISKGLELPAALLPALLKLYLQCKTYHIQLYFIAPSPRIFLVFRKAGLLEILPVFLSRDEYLQGNRIKLSENKFI